MCSLAYNNNIDIDSSSRTSTKYDETTDNMNHDLLEINKTYTIINITFNGSSKKVRRYYRLKLGRYIFNLYTTLRNIIKTISYYNLQILIKSDFIEFNFFLIFIYYLHLLKKVPINTLAEARQVSVLDRPQKTITTKKNHCYLVNSNYLLHLMNYIIILIIYTYWIYYTI